MAHKKMGEKIRCFEVVPSSIKLPCEQFTHALKQHIKSMKMTDNEKCQVVLFYLPIVTKAMTDIQGALNKISEEYKDKYVALVVLHHTFDPEFIVPDSNRAVNKDSNEKTEKLFVVDCLFHEDNGLLKCRKNYEAKMKVADWLHDVKRKNRRQRHQSEER